MGASTGRAAVLQRRGAAGEVTPRVGVCNEGHFKQLGFAPSLHLKYFIFMSPVNFSLYLITDRHQTAGRPLLPVLDGLDAGVKAMQLREKDLGTRPLLELGAECLSFTEARWRLLFKRSSRSGDGPWCGRRSSSSR